MIREVLNKTIPGEINNVKVRMRSGKTDYKRYQRMLKKKEKVRLRNYGSEQIQL